MNIDEGRRRSNNRKSPKLLTVTLNYRVQDMLCSIRSRKTLLML